MPQLPRNGAGPAYWRKPRASGAGPAPKERERQTEQPYRR
jgi:hypothetical protein